MKKVLHWQRMGKYIRNLLISYTIQIYIFPTGKTFAFSPTKSAERLNLRHLSALITGDERIELPLKVLETSVIPFDQSPIYNYIEKENDIIDTPFSLICTFKTSYISAMKFVSLYSLRRTTKKHFTAFILANRSLSFLVKPSTY